jgi:hypothetical protein
MVQYISNSLLLLQEATWQVDVLAVGLALCVCLSAVLVVVL